MVWAASCSLVVSLAPTALAEETGFGPPEAPGDSDVVISAENPLELLEELTEWSDDTLTGVLDGVAEAPESPEEHLAIDETINGVDVIVPVDPSDPVLLGSQDDSWLGINLPYSDEAKDAEFLTDGVVHYDTDEYDASSNVVVKDDGSVQVVTVIDNRDSPTRYPYALDLPDGATIEQLDGGTVLILDADGEFFSAIAPAWAVDSTGTDVRTHYEIDGTTVTQVVEHRSSDVSYPVTADPWLGRALWGGTWYNRKGLYLNKFTVSARLSQWGWSIYIGSVATSALAGVGGNYIIRTAIIRTAGWNELKAKRPRVNTTSMHQQYLCHVRYGYALYGAGFHWDLESARPTKSNWATTNVWSTSHRCNW